MSPTPPRPPPQPPPARADSTHRSAQLAGGVPRDGQEPAPGGDGGALPKDHPPGYDDGNDDRCLTPEAWEKIYGDVLGGVQPTVDLFATRRNAHCAKYYTASTDAFKHPWVHESAHANPPFRGATAARAVVRGYTEWKKSPTTTSFTIFLPLWEGAPHSADKCADLAAFDKVYTFPPGSFIFTEPASDGTAARVPCGPTPWPVEVYHLARADAVVENITSASLLHRRMGHMGVVKIMGAAAAGIIKLNGVTRTSLTTACTTCAVCRIANAMRKVPTSALRERSVKPLSLVHVDICGPFATSIDGYQYAMALRCDSTRWTAATFLKARGDAGDALTSLLHDLRDELGRHSARPGAAAVHHQVGVFQCDNAKEFTSQTGKFAKAVRAAGGTMRFSSAYHHEQQGVIERHWQTLQAMSRATLLAADINASWWYAELSLFDTPVPATNG